MKLLLSLPAADNDRQELGFMGIEDEIDMDNEMVLVKSLFLSAASGNVKAFDRIMDLIGKTVAREELSLRKQEIKRRDAPSNGKLEELIAGLREMEVDDDLHEEAGKTDESVEDE